MNSGFFSIRTNHPGAVQKILNGEKEIVIGDLSSHKDDIKLGDIVFLVISGDEAAKKFDYTNGLRSIAKVTAMPVLAGGKKYSIGLQIINTFSNSITKFDLYPYVKLVDAPYIGPDTKGPASQAIRKLSSEVVLELLLALKDLGHDYDNDLLKLIHGKKVTKMSLNGKMVERNTSFFNSNLVEKYIEWFYLAENFKETYDGVVEVEFLSFLDLEFFEGKLFHEPISDVDLYISSANKLITSIKTERWEKFKTALGNGVPSAILGKQNYLKFLGQNREFLLSLVEVNIPFDVNHFISDLTHSELKYSNLLQFRLVASLLSKRFLILTGLAGSGKTKLAQAFAMWMCTSRDQYKLVPVGADWTNREPLLGYRDALSGLKYVKPDTGVLDLILRAEAKSNEPHFLILDEMNLSHVERYFADFLSAMESKEGILLHSVKKGLVMEDGVPMAPSLLIIPKNLFIIGTVNIDETTYMFSPKVLDRANVIEFRVEATDMEVYFDSEMKVDLDTIAGKGKSMASDFLALAKVELASLPEDDTSKLNAKLLVFFAELKKVGAEFGYRSAGDIYRLATRLKVMDPTMDINTIIDIAVMQKLLPKLHGSRRKLSGVLTKLAEQCASGSESKTVKKALDEPDYDKALSGLDIRHPLSFEKVWRMYRNAIDNGYASYAEA